MHDAVANNAVANCMTLLLSLVLLLIAWCSVTDTTTNLQIACHSTTIYTVTTTTTNAITVTTNTVLLLVVIANYSNFFSCSVVHVSCCRLPLPSKCSYIIFSTCPSSSLQWSQGGLWLRRQLVNSVRGRGGKMWALRACVPRIYKNIKVFYKVLCWILKIY